MSLLLVIAQGALFMVAVSALAPALTVWCLALIHVTEWLAKKWGFM